MTMKLSPGRCRGFCFQSVFTGLRPTLHSQKNFLNHITNQKAQAPHPALCCNLCRALAYPAFLFIMSASASATSRAASLASESELPLAPTSSSIDIGAYCWL